MISIVKANENDINCLIELATVSFKESHGHSATAADINTYVDEYYHYERFKTELSDPNISYHIIHYQDLPVGYSKISFNTSHPKIKLDGLCKLDRIYLLKAYYGLKLGYQLFDYNLNLSKLKAQKGMWLNVWIENQKAIDFYNRLGFEIIGEYDFPISETHSNPNHQMFLKY